MLTEIGIYRSPNAVIHGHGEDAGLEAATRANAVLKKGELAACIGGRPNVRKWLQADSQSAENDVCSTPSSGHSTAHAGLPLLTHNRHHQSLVSG